MIPHTARSPLLEKNGHGYPTLRAIKRRAAASSRWWARREGIARMKNMGGSGRDAYGSCFFIPLVPVFNLVVRRGNREFHVQIRHRVLPIPFLRLGSSSTRKKFLRISPSFSSRVKKDRCAHDSKNSESRHRPMTILSIRGVRSPRRLSSA